MSADNPTPARTLSCGWCPTPLPDDYDEIGHHFLVQHNISNGDRSVRFHYADQLPAELRELEASL